MMEDNAVKILVTGDFCPVNRIEDLALRKDYDSIFNDFIDVFRGNDLNITDLECPLTMADSARPKTGPHQKAHPECIGVLNYAGIGLAAMANNHVMDYDNTGILDTLVQCNKNDISTVGIGSTPAEAANPFTIKIRNKKIGVLNYADNEFLSTPDGSYNCNPVDPLSCFQDISKLRQDHDFIIAIIHAGNEFYELPSPRTRSLYRFIVDIGADVVISHHTHAFSGYEVYKSKPIFYGLGNFLYDWPGKTGSRWNRGYVVRLLLSEKCKFEIIPLKQCDEIPGVFHLNSQETTDFNIEMDRLNLIIADDRKLESAFKDYCNSIFPMYNAFIEPNFGKYITGLRKRGFFPKLVSRRKRLLFLNLIRCESHRDVLLRMLKQYEQKS